MSRLDRFIRKTVVEKGEYIRDTSGNVSKVTSSPTHNDKVLIEGDKVKNVPSGKGGVSLSNIESVVSATHENRSSKDKLYTHKDENIKIFPDDVSDFADSLGIKIPKTKKGISPAKLIDLGVEGLNSFKMKFNKKDYTTDEYSLNSATANENILNSLPKLEDIYSAALELQESKKPQEDLEYAQRGKSPTLYVDSVNDPRYRAYRDSLDLANDYIYYNFGEKIFNPEDTFSKEFVKNNITQGTFLPFSDAKNKSIRNTKILPVGFADIYNNPNKLKYGYETRLMYRHPNQQVVVDPRLRFPKVNSIQNQTSPSFNSIDLPEINEQLVYNPGTYEGYQREAGSEYRRNPDGTYGSFNHRWSGGKWNRTPRQTGGYAQGGFFDERLKELGVGRSTKTDQDARNRAWRTIRPSDETDINNYARYLTNTTRNEWDDAVSEEAWAKYLNQNKPAKYLQPTTYTPPSDWSGNFPNVKDYQRLHDAFENDLMYTYWDDLEYNTPKLVNEHDLKSRDFKPVDLIGKGDADDVMNSRARVLRNYHIRKNKDDKGDYLEYFDMYDLPEAAEKRFKGMPFGIYNRIYKQSGGQKGILQRDPYMNGNRPTARVQLNNGRLVPVEYLDGRTISMDDMFYSDSVYVDKNKATRFYDKRDRQYLKKK